MIKQVIVIRTDYEKNGQKFRMRKGKEIAQGAHASMWFLADRLTSGIDYDHFSDVEMQWLQNKFVKIVLQVKTEQELIDLHVECEQKKIINHLVLDCANTEFDEPTYTALGIGPDYSEKIDPITKDLKLY